MHIIKAETKAQIKKYFRFVNELYKGDNGYVCTAKFNAQSLLYRRTGFAKSCFIQPAIVFDGEAICAVCTFIHNPKLPYLQIGLFEAKAGADEAVKLLIDKAKEIAIERNLEKIIVGLNGHLSYGVGILEENFDGKISFDSIYNKPYYKAFFEPYICGRETLCTYRAPIDAVLKKIEPLRARTAATVREANLKKFAAETEVLRRLCNRTLIKTSFYTPADSGHFTELMGGLKVFLHGGNLLFALNNGEESGFLFWHPDYNSMLCGGRDYNLLHIYIKAKKAFKKSGTFKINAIGSAGDNPFITAALIAKVMEKAAPNYKFVETTFVWDNNLSSKSLTGRIFGEPYRKYGVYFIDV